MSEGYARLELIRKENKMESKEMLDEALDLLTNKNLAKGDDWTKARLLAFSAMYGMLGHKVSKKQARIVLEIAGEWN
jgi:hypothetical protein